jgi:5-(carboxyamino)imidazole ribonucleotide synthase
MGSGILKTAEGGYDGKGQIQIHNKNHISKAFDTFEGKMLIFEQRVNFKMEISVIVGRRKSGEMLAFEPAYNIHKN